MAKRPRDDINLKEKVREDGETRQRDEPTKPWLTDGRTEGFGATPRYNKCVSGKRGLVTPETLDLCRDICQV